MGDDGRLSDRDLTQHLATFGDTLSWQKGRHALKFGTDFVRNEAYDGFSALRDTPQSSLTYSGSNLTGYTNFLLGNAIHQVTYVDLPRPPMDVSNWETAYYAQDDFRVNSRLTLNLGMSVIKSTNPSRMILPKSQASKVTVCRVSTTSSAKIWSANLKSKRPRDAVLKRPEF